MGVMLKIEVKHRGLALAVQAGLQTGILYIGEDAFEMSLRNLAKA